MTHGRHSVSMSSLISRAIGDTLMTSNEICTTKVFTEGSESWMVFQLASSWAWMVRNTYHQARLGQLIRCDVGNLRIPLFTNFLICEKTARQCIVCTETIYELNLPSDRNWLKACEDFEGKWMWSIRQFPTVKHLSYDHPLNVCGQYMATHLKKHV